MTDAEEISDNEDECPACSGKGRVISLIIPLIATAIGFGMAWFSWPKLSSIPTLTRAYTIESILFFAIGGPLIVIGSWWKLFCYDCEDCGGSGELRDRVLYRQPTAVVDAVHRVIQTDQACHKCQYNLRELLIGNRCPECGDIIIPASQAQRVRDSRIALRLGLAAAVIFPIGIIISTLIWGNIGPAFFIVGWTAVYLLLRVILVGGRIIGSKRNV